MHNRACIIFVKKSPGAKNWVLNRRLRLDVPNGDSQFWSKSYNSELEWLSSRTKGHSLAISQLLTKKTLFSPRVKFKVKVQR